MNSMETEQPSTELKFDDYQILHRLGQGGMSDVYLAKNTRLHRKVAIKVLKPDAVEPGRIDRVLNEARLLAKVNHPNIVQVYDITNANGQIALVMEYVQGKTLQQYHSEKVLSLPDKLALIEQISKGLAVAHKHNVVHCDLKPDNIMIDGRGQVKITDFGIGLDLLSQQQPKAPDEQAYRRYVSARASSPEQLNEGEVDFRSDLFALGLLAFNLIGNEHPFGSGSAAQVAQRIIKRKAKDARQLIPALPVELCTLLNQLLQKQPAKRPQNSELVASQFKQVLVMLSDTQNLAQDTMALDDIAIKPVDANKPKKVALAVALACTVMLSVLGYAFYPQTPTRHIAVLRPTLSATSAMAQMQQDLIVATIDDAVRQQIIATENMRLIPHREITAIDVNQPGAIKAVGDATGATDIITTELDCNNSRCDVTFLRLSGKNWTVKSRQHWPTVVENFTSLYSSGQSYLSALYPDFEFADPTPQTINEQDYLSYIRLYSKVIFQGHSTVEVLEQLKQVLTRSPYLLPAYRLYRETALNLYHETKDPDYPVQLQQLMDAAPSEYRYSVFQAIDAFWLAVSLEQLSEAQNWIEQAQKRGADQSTLIELQAYWYQSSDQLVQSIEYYQKALKLRPSTGLLLNLAHSYWWNSDLRQAKKTLLRLLSIIADHDDAKRLLAVISLQEGDVNGTISAYEQMVATNLTSMDLSNLSLAYTLNGQHDKALLLAARAVKKSPGHPTRLLNLADAQMILGLTEQANSHYLRVIELHQGKNDLKSWIEKAQAYVHTDAGEAAIRALNMAKKLAPENGEVSFTAALVYARLNANIAAVAQVEEALGKGVGAVWFDLPLFDSLCGNQRFKRIMAEQSSRLRCPG
jgi:serine/threonine protein kinase/tetratricopeptide (TPR) repeat protein